MGIQITELRGQDVEAIDQLAPDAASRVAHDLGLSLVAHEAGQLVGAIFCSRDGKCYLNRVVLADPAREHDVGRLLIDKAMVKLRARGVHRCRIVLPGKEQDFWNAARWALGEGDPAAAGLLKAEG